jgi:hypothetical protein
MFSGNLLNFEFSETEDSNKSISKTINLDKFEVTRIDTKQWNDHIQIKISINENKNGFSYIRV